MTIVENFVFCDTASTTALSNTLVNTQGEELVLQVGGVTSLEVEGLVDLNSTDWTPLAIINATNFDIAGSITSDGVYMVSIAGISAIRTNNTTASSIGGVAAFGKVVG